MHFKHSQIVVALAAALSLSAHADNDTSRFVPGAMPPATAIASTAATSTAATTRPMSTTSSTSNSGTTQVSRLTTQYAAWAGSSANAQSLVTGLRTGTPVTLQSTSPALSQPATFTPPTRTMGWGNVSKALSLAQADLAAAGITNPTPQQLQTALTGGSITSAQGTTTRLDGILTLRSQGLGWGQIAHKLDLQPGAAFRSAPIENRTASLRSTHELHQELRHDDDLHHVEHELHETHHVVTAGGTTVSRSSHISTASGEQNHGSHQQDHHENHYASAHESHAFVSRVVTASGSPMTAGSTIQHVEHGSGHVEIQHVSHVTTASGGSLLAGGSGNGGNAGSHSGHDKH